MTTLIEDKSLMFHQGRINLIFYPIDLKYDEAIQKLQNKKIRDLYMYNTILNLMKDGIWSDQYHIETIQAISDNEYWFEYINISDQNINSSNININITPRQQYIDIKDRLDEKHVLHNSYFSTKCKL